MKEMTKQESLWKVFDKFNTCFKNYKYKNLISQARDKLMLYILYLENPNSEEFLNQFVGAYFEIKEDIVSSRNHLINIVQSDEFKKESLINRLKTRKELHDYQSLCKVCNKFEREFYERVNISLLRVENERCAREKDEKHVL